MGNYCGSDGEKFMKDGIEVIVLKGFCTQDAWGIVNANEGDILTLHITLACQLTKEGYVRKNRKKRKVKHG